MKKTFLLPAAVLFFAACRNEQPVRIKTPKEAPPSMARPAPSAPAPGSDMAGAPQFPTASAEGVHWSVPAGWKELPASGMRAGTLVPPSGDGTEVSIFALPGDAGGDLANVNRWRGQIGLGPIDAAELSRSRQAVKSGAGTVSLYDFTGGGGKPSRLAAGLVKIGEDSWFFKLMGPSPSVGTALPAFKKFLASLQAHAH